MMTKTFASVVLAAAVVLAPSLGLAQETGGTTGKVNSVDATKHVVNLTHGPIATLGWPGMTMDFGVAPSIDLGTVKAGDSVAFTVVKSANGAWVVDSIKPAR